MFYEEKRSTCEEMLVNKRRFSKNVLDLIVLSKYLNKLKIFFKLTKVMLVKKFSKTNYFL